MATLKQKIAAERAARDMLADNGMPQPDRVEYGSACIRFLFHRPGVAVVIEIDGFPTEYDDPIGGRDDVDHEEAA